MSQFFYTYKNIVIRCGYVSCCIFFLALCFSQVQAQTTSDPPKTSPSLTQEIVGQYTAGADRAELGTPVAPQVIIASVIKIFLGMIGSIFLILLILSGYWLITARGEEEKISKARDTAKRATIGTFVVLIAYAITTLIGNAVTTTLQEQEQYSGSRNTNWTGDDFGEDWENTSVDSEYYYR